MLAVVEAGPSLLEFSGFRGGGNVPLVPPLELLLIGPHSILWGAMAPLAPGGGPHDYVRTECS